MCLIQDKFRIKWTSIKLTSISAVRSWIFSQSNLPNRKTTPELPLFCPAVYTNFKTAPEKATTKKSINNTKSTQNLNLILLNVIFYFTFP